MSVIDDPLQSSLSVIKRYDTSTSCIILRIFSLLPFGLFNNLPKLHVKTNNKLGTRNCLKLKLFDFDAHCFTRYQDLWFDITMACSLTTACVMQSLSTTVKAPGAIDLVYFDVKFRMFCLNWVNKFCCFAFQNGKILMLGLHMFLFMYVTLQVFMFLYTSFIYFHFRVEQGRGLVLTP